MTNPIPFYKKWPFYVATTAFIGILLTVILRIITPPIVTIPQTEFVSTNKNGSVSSFSNITFSGQQPEISQNLYMVAVKPLTDYGQAVKNFFIEKNNVPQVKNVQNVWRNDEFLVVISQADNLYSISSVKTVKENILKDEEKAFKKAQEFVDLYFGKGKFSPQKNNVTFFAGIEEAFKSERKNASIIEIPFSYSVLGLPIYIEYFSQAPIMVALNSESNIQKVTFQKDFLDFEVTQKKLISISVEEALENINKNQIGSVISAHTESFGELSLAEFRKGDFSKVTLEYRADLTNEIAYPFYRFEGELINKDNKLVYTQVITPAVKLQ